MITSNYIANPMIAHLNKRGYLTSYWVINDDKDLEYVIRNTPIGGIMSDRPSLLKEKVLKYQE